MEKVYCNKFLNNVAWGVKITVPLTISHACMYGWELAPSPKWEQDPHLVSCAVSFGMCGAGPYTTGDIFAPFYYYTFPSPPLG